MTFGCGMCGEKLGRRAAELIDDPSVPVHALRFDGRLWFSSPDELLHVCAPPTTRDAQPAVPVAQAIV